jgi:hypothetical protein
VVAIFSADHTVGHSVFMLPPGFPVPPGPIVTTQTVDSPDGWFDVEAGTIAVVYVGVSAPGYRLQQTSEISNHGHPVEIELVEARRIRGRVLDDQNRPVSGAAVFFDSPSRPLSEAMRDAAGFTPFAHSDTRGEFAIDEPVTPTLDLLVMKDPYLAQRVRIRREDPAFSVVLRDGVPLRGSVLSADLKTISGAAVEAQCEGYDPLRTLTRADGTFLFAALPRSRCQVLASRTLIESGHEVVLDPMRGSTIVDLSSGPATVRLVILPSGRIHGRIRGLARIDQGYAATARRDGQVVPLAVDTSGAFGGRLDPGFWELRGTFDKAGTHLETITVNVDIADGGDRDVELTFPNQTVVRVVVNGQPLTSELTIKPNAESVPTMATIFPAASGNYEVRGLRAGLYIARFAYGDYEVAAKIAVPSSSELDLQLLTSELQVSDIKGHPLDADVEIVGRELRPERFEVTGTGPHAFSAAGEGRHIARDLLPGRYEVTIRARGYKESHAVIDVPGQPAPVLLDTIDRPYPRPAAPPTLDESLMPVFRPVLDDLARQARVWGSGQQRGRLVLADQTVYRPDSLNVDVDSPAASDGLRKAEQSTLFSQFTRATAGVKRLPHFAFPGVLVVRFQDLPLLPPRRWEEVEFEVDLFDLDAMWKRWDRAAGFVFLTAPEISADGSEAVVAAMLRLRSMEIPRWYWLVKGSTGWKVRASGDFPLDAED